jgi:hypothetical protein
MASSVRCASAMKDRMTLSPSSAPKYASRNSSQNTPGTWLLPSTSAKCASQNIFRPSLDIASAPSRP